MYRTISILLLGFVATVSGASQTPGQTTKCKLTPGQVSIRGVKLGMTTDEVSALFPGAAEESQNQLSLQRAAGFPSFGLAYLGVTPNRDAANKNNFKGIESYNITFFDGRVVNIEAFYQGPNSTPRGPQWPNTDELISKFSETYHLPGPGDWVDRNGGTKIVTCAGLDFMVAGGSAARASLLQSPPSWRDEIKKRQLAYEDKLRSEFKP